LRRQAHAAQTHQQMVGHQSQTVAGTRGGRPAHGRRARRRADGQAICAEARDPGAACGRQEARLEVTWRGVGPVDVVAMLVIVLSGTVSVGRVAVPIGALLVLAWARWSGTPWHEIGFAQPGSWIASLTLGVAGGIAFKFMMKAII